MTQHNANPRITDTRSSTPQWLSPSVVTTDFARAISKAWLRQSMRLEKTAGSFCAELPPRNFTSIFLLPRRCAAQFRGMLLVSQFPKDTMLLFSAEGRTPIIAGSAPPGRRGCTGDCHGCGWVGGWVGGMFVRLCGAMTQHFQRQNDEFIRLLLQHTAAVKVAAVPSYSACICMHFRGKYQHYSGNYCTTTPRTAATGYSHMRQAASQALL